MSTFSAVLSALGLAPKTLPQANETLTAARAQLDSVNALFTAAGLPLEQMLATGPDSLKAHLASLDKSADVTRLSGELSTAAAALSTAQASLDNQAKIIAAHDAAFTAIGLQGAPTPPEDFKKAFESHVSKQATLALAKTGHPPAHVPAADTGATATKTDAELAAEYTALPRGQAKTAFYAKHEQALWRHEQTTRNRAE
jgi:hypothetical protein